MSANSPNNVFSIDPNAPDPTLIARAADIMNSGGVVIFPTQSLYGLGTDALNEDAVDRVFNIKQRPPDKPVLILINDISDIDHLVNDVPPAADRIMEACWPGGVTLVCRARSDLPRNLTAGTDKIGIRQPLHPVARHLVKAAGGPITGTSANLSGMAGCATVFDIDPRVLKGVNMALDAGLLIGGVGSTVVDVTETPIQILREGIVPKERIFDAISGL